jgi:hypothetical protein
MRRTPTCAPDAETRRAVRWAERGLPTAEASPAIDAEHQRVEASAA